MYSNRLFSPLRYPGGKVRFAPFIREVMQANNLDGCHYCEPFAGGAAVALDVLFSGVASHVHINDLDDAVHSFWRAVLDVPDHLMKLVNDTPLTIEQWHRWRTVFLQRPNSSSPAELGFATLFMNRTNRSGILKGGVIGGKQQLGTYKLDARFNKAEIISRIERIAERAADISLYHQDAAEFLRAAPRLLPRKTLLYLDPPYFVKGQGLYRNFYERRDHLEIARIVQATRFTRPWIVSYDASPEICEMYARSSGLTYELFYSAQVKHSGREVMFFSQSLVVPEPTSLPTESSSVLAT